ncbi:hypothetical protein EJ110_NYTH32288 [Nymphaea thermarum]|nr:hypothetical protein EJ110_NYTH32288 [Nymphaea thermarum]
MRYINGKGTTPPKTCEEWEANNRIVMPWLLNSMECTIAKVFLFDGVGEGAMRLLTQDIREVHNGKDHIDDSPTQNHEGYNV